TRFSRDWSSDVCSSDLARRVPLLLRRRGMFLHFPLLVEEGWHVVPGWWFSSGCDVVFGSANHPSAPRPRRLCPSFTGGECFCARSEERRVVSGCSRLLW